MKHTVCCILLTIWGKFWPSKLTIFGIGKQPDTSAPLEIFFSRCNCCHSSCEFHLICKILVWVKPKGYGLKCQFFAQKSSTLYIRVKSQKKIIFTSIPFKRMSNKYFRAYIGYQRLPQDLDFRHLKKNGIKILKNGRDEPFVMIHECRTSAAISLYACRLETYIHPNHRTCKDP